MSSPLSARQVQGHRCPCHNHLFGTRAELRHHLSACSLSTVQVGNYQTWLDQLDVTQPLPKLLPRQQTNRVNMPTASSRHRDDAQAAVLSARANLSASPTGLNSSVASLRLNRSKRDKGSAAAVWESAFADQPAVRHYLMYLLSYGSVQQLDEYQPHALTRDVHADLLRMFRCLDRAGSGRVTIDDFIAASRDAFGTVYFEKNFTRADKSRAGSLDFVAVMRLYFPQTPSKRLAATHEKLLRPTERVPTTREVMAPADVAAVDAAYDRIVALPGGATLPNLVSTLSQYSKEHQAEFEPIFAQHDADGDGRLTRDEFLEMVKGNYPPFRKDRSQAWQKPGAKPFDVKEFDHWYSRDGRVFFPRLPRSTHRPYGAVELQTVAVRNSQQREQDEFEEYATNLHVRDNVRRFASHVNKGQALNGV
jgi:hypothetical protein